MTEAGEREWERGEYTISTDKKRLDFHTIHDFIANQSYWAQGRSTETMQRALDNSLNFGLYKHNLQIGFARVVTDYATFAWIADVFVLPDYRGRGLSKWLLEVILAHPDLQAFRRWVLATKDAHTLYARFGFIPLHRPERWMERPDPSMQESPDYWKDDLSS
jgi:GNAT superfamily N-acetyltransferase